MQALIKQIDIERIAENLWRLVNVRSPTGNERDAALLYAELLEETGADIEIDESIFCSPNIVARLKGNRPGKTVQLAGHLDHIHAPHPEPKRKDYIISGRGSSDMKNGLASFLEVIRILKKNGCDFPGQVLVTAYGLHESPWGNHKGLLGLIKKGITGDAAIVGESFTNSVVVKAKGQAIWNINIKRQGEACHELALPAGSTELFGILKDLISALQQKNCELALEKANCELLGPETLFVGQIHYGDFYNRVPNECKLQGTYRWHPRHSFEEIQFEMKNLVETIHTNRDISIELTWILSGESYQMDPNHEIVSSFRRAHKAITHSTIPIGGTAVITDACRLVRVGNIPTVTLNFDNENAHSDYEFVQLAKVHTSCKILLATVLDYLMTYSSQ